MTAPMDANRWARIRAIFEQASERPPAQRAAFLDQACGGDAELRREVESLLGQADADAKGLNTGGAVPHASTDLRPPPIAPVLERPGSRVGPYKLLQQIGEGGFGTVFMAEQEKPVRRRVALKVLKLGMDTKAVVARFEAERQALALMDHPHIAKVFDSGSTDTGRPFFVMEYVTGHPITRFADEHRLSVRARLTLFAQVCAAVQHAHTKGVIHRDIKPGNVLVSMTDGQPFAKVIDFGIAKALAQPLTDKTLFTEHRQLIGTPEYMSPEQAQGSADIDTRTDVYALGVLLYELLSGGTPFDGKRLRSAAHAEIQRILREEDPPVPSLRITGDPASVRLLAVRRADEPERLRGLIRGELDWIVMKALEKDRARRYETPNQLADDVRRHLSGEPVVAAPPSPAYRLRKFVRRHRGPVLAAAAVLLALVLGLAGTLWQASAARREAANARAAEAEQARLREQADAKTAEAEKARAVADQSRAEADERGRQIEQNAYVANVQMAGEHSGTRQWDRLRERLDACPERLRGWEWEWLNASSDNGQAVLKGHTGEVHSAEFSPDGTRIVTASNDSTARVWDAATGASLAELKGHTGAVYSAAFSPDGTRIVTSSGDGTARVWDAATGASLAELKGHTEWVNSAAFSPDGTRIVTASADRTARVWDSVPYRIRYAERLANARGENGGAIVKAWQAAVKAGTEKEFVVSLK